MRKPVFLLLALLCGCPYSSPVPLAPAKDATFDESLLGRWHLKEDKIDLLVLRFNENEYYLEMTERKKEPKTTRFRGHLTKVDGVSFLNVCPIDSADADDRKWSFAAWAVKNGAFELKLIEDKLLKEPFDKSADLVKAVKTRLKDPALFGELVRFERRK